MTLRSVSSATLVHAAFWAAIVVPVAAQTVDRLVAKNVTIAHTTFKGRRAVQLIATPASEGCDVLRGTERRMRIIIP